MELWPGLGLDLGISVNVEASGKESLVGFQQSRSSEARCDVVSYDHNGNIKATKATQKFVSQQKRQEIIPCVISCPPLTDLARQNILAA